MAPHTLHCNRLLHSHPDLPVTQFLTPALTAQRVRTNCLANSAQWHSWQYNINRATALDSMGPARFTSLDRSPSEQWYPVTLHGAVRFVTHKQPALLPAPIYCAAVINRTVPLAGYHSAVLRNVTSCASSPVVVTNVTPCTSNQVVCYQCDAMYQQSGSLLPMWRHVPAVR